jgi:hypothetical protein
MPEAAKWSHSGRKMDDEAALRAARKAGSAQPRRPAGKDKGTKR